MASSSIETYGSSSSSSNSSSYLTSFSTVHDVFLSFRSTDTGKALVKPLCTALKSNGIRPFYYDRKLQVADEMFSQPAIEMSRLSIVVLSKNYASSTWCLYELVKILRTVRRNKQVLVPIFYDVNPSDVRHQTGKFGQTFSKHTRDLQKRVDTWKASLYEIASLSEYYYVQSGRFIKPNDLLISQIVRHVKQIIRDVKSSLLDAETPSLMNFRAREEEMEVQLDFLQTELTLSDTENLVGTVEKLLGYKLTKSKFVAIRKLELMHIWNLKLSDFPKNLSFPDLRRLCIHYSDNIDTSMIDYGIPYSFFELMPGLKSLDMSNTNIKDLPPSVTKLIKLESLILRGCNLLTELPPKIESLVNLTELDISGCTMLATYPDQSMNFPRYLRRLNMQDLKSLTKLPESITKLRSLHYLNLSGCTNLAEIPESIELLPRLSSLDLSDCKTLTKLPKSICKLTFLEDIYLSGCSSLFQSPTGLDEPEVSINRLSTNRRAAITEIHLDFHKECGILSDINDLLSQMEKVLEYKFWESECVSVRNLEVIHIRNSNLSEISKNFTFPDLRMLFLHSDLHLTYIPSSFFEQMPALTILDMSGTSVKMLPLSVIKLIKLEELRLQHCELLKELPDEIDALVNLKMLDLTDCKILTKLPETITRVGSLQHLSLSGCINLAELPECIAWLWNLCTLDLTDCKSLTNLPEYIGELSSLKQIKMSGCSGLFNVPTGLIAVEVCINRLPNHSRKYKMELQLDFPKGDGTLSDIEDLLCLIENILEYEFLISEVVVGEKLTVMYIRNVKLSEIPKNISFPSLEMLFLDSHFDLTDIPSLFFEKMPALQVLDMSNTSIKTLPPSISKLIKLKKLFLRHCELLMELPCEIGALVNLKVMDLEGTDLASLPEELGELINLKCLKVSLYDAESYRDIKRIVAIIPEKALSKLTQLDELSIDVDPQDTWCDAAVRVIIKDLPGLRNLKTLKIYLPNTVLLQDLLELKWNNTDLSIYQTLANFNIIIGPNAQHFITRLPRDLEEEFLKLKKCLKYINGEGSTAKFAEALKHANALYIDRHWTIQTLSVFRLEELKELKYCLLVDCNKMHTVFDESDFDHGVADKADTFLSLQYLAIHYLKDLQVIWKGPSIGCCVCSLKVLTIHMCPNLNTIFTRVLLGDLVNLKEIIVEDCPKIKTLIADDGSQFTCEQTLPELKKLSLFYLPELVSISSGISIGLKLENIIIYDCPKLKRFPSLCNEKVVTTIIKGEREWWDALEWNEPEWSDGRPDYLGDAFYELDPDGDEVLAAPGYENSLHLLVEECNDNLKSEDSSMKLLNVQ